MTIFIRGTKGQLNKTLQEGNHIPVMEFTKDAERQALLDEYPTGTDVNLWEEYDSQRVPIVKSYAIYNKVKNKIE